MIPIVVLSGVLAGLFAHYGVFFHGEWHLRLKAIVFGHSVLAIGVYYLAQQTTTTQFEAVLLSAVFHTSYISSLFGSMTIYRLFFSPLVIFRGPKLAAVTKFWHVFQARHSTNHLVMQDLHEKYGPFVRTGPNEITVFHAEAIEAFDSSKAKAIKDEFYDLIHPLTSAVFTRDPIVHRQRRAVWTQGLGTKALNDFSPRLAQLTEKLKDCISDLGNDGQLPVNVVDVMSWFAFDAMGEVLFGQDFHMIENRQYHPAVSHQKRALAVMGPILNTMWIPRLAFTFFPFLGRVHDWIHMVTFCNESMATRMKVPSKKFDLASLFIDEYERLSGTETLRMRNDILNGSTISAVVAGSDSTRASFIAIFWFLSKFPDHAKKVYDELQSLNDVHDANALAALPHLNGVINEALRLLPPVLTGNGRISGPEGLTIDGTFIPGNTKIHAPKYCIQRLASAFRQPDEFIPERWYSRPELIMDKRAFRPFGVGNRICVGKTLAYIELRLVTAILLNHFDVSFAPNYMEDKIFTGLRDHVTAQPGDTMCIFRPRN